MTKTSAWRLWRKSPSLPLSKARRGAGGRADAGLGGYLALCLSTASLALVGPALAQGVVKDKQANWQTHCETPPGAQREQCSILQSVVAEDRPKVILTIILLKTADGKSRLMRIIAPNGVLLPIGLGLKIDADDLGKLAYARCLPIGCVAEAELDDKLLSRLENGKTATLVIFQTPEEGIGVPLPLDGLKESFDHLP